VAVDKSVTYIFTAKGDKNTLATFTTVHKKILNETQQPEKQSEDISEAMRKLQVYIKPKKVS